MAVKIEKRTLSFLDRLAKNNNREWFYEHKDDYENAKLNVEGFADAMIAKLSRHDKIQTRTAKECLWRIYNDVRFSKDKTPYNPRFGGHFKRVKPFLRGGYYFWIKPGETRIGCGFTYPNAIDLKRIREDITYNLAEWNRMLRSKRIVQHFGEMRGERVQTIPRGFSKDDPARTLLCFKQYWFERSFSDNEVLSPGFISEVDASYKAIRPFFDYMTEVLTTDTNGNFLL